MRVIIYTDGASRGNPGPGGYGIYMFIEGTRHHRQQAKGFRLTTNNRMELTAVIAALEQLKNPPQEVVLYTDSKYVSDAVNRHWLANWVKTDFKDKKNADLWKAFLPLYEQHHVRIRWVKGHAENSYNERADQLAVAASRGKALAIDQGYERGAQSPPQMPPCPVP